MTENHRETAYAKINLRQEDDKRIAARYATFESYHALIQLIKKRRNEINQ